MGGMTLCIYFFTYIYEGCSKFFHVENVIFAQKKYFRQTLANPMFTFSGTCRPRLVRKTLVRDLLKFVPGLCSLSQFILWQLHLNIYVSL